MMMAYHFHMDSLFFLHHLAYHMDNCDKNFGFFFFFVVLEFCFFSIVLDGRIFGENAFKHFMEFIFLFLTFW